MKDPRLDRLLSVARLAPPAALPADFAAEVTTTVRRMPEPASSSLFAELNNLFPRLAWTAMLVMALCLAGDFGHSLMSGPDLTDGVTQWLEQWLMTGS